jgi:hypothetical protein
MTDDATLGEVAYAAYGRTTDFKNYQGLPMPAWTDLGDTIRQAWENAATAATQPRRGDPVEAWLKGQRDEFEYGDSVWPILDYVLDQYRLHADTSTPLDEHCCEGGNVDDCAGCYDAKVAAGGGDE